MIDREWKVPLHFNCVAALRYYKCSFVKTGIVACTYFFRNEKCRCDNYLYWFMCVLIHFLRDDINWVQFKRVYNTVICYNSADTASARRVRETVELLRRETPDLSLLDLWPPNSPNPSTQWTIGYGQPCREYVYQTPTALKNSYWNSGWWFGSCAVLTRTLSTLALSSSVEDCENRPFRARQLTHCVVTVRLCRVLKYSQPYWRNAKEMLIFSTKLFC